MDFNNSQAIYLQIADYVCDQIQQQQLGPNAKVPSVRELAVILEVNPNTVMRAYEYLQQQKIIYTRRGLGYFVDPEAPASIDQQRRARFLDEDLTALFEKMTRLKIDLPVISEQFSQYLQSLKKQNENKH